MPIRWVYSENEIIGVLGSLAVHSIDIDLYM